MKNYKYSFLALIFALSAVSYSSAYEFNPEKDREACPETCTEKRSCRRDADERRPLTMTKCLKAAACVLGYYLWLENVPDRVGSRYGESGKEVVKVLPAVLLVEPVKDVLRSCGDMLDRVVDNTVRSVC